jgi:UDP-N-acetylmuramoyl-L-alanyl-D-glutamate--2,6-diaminopimelate ligase
MSIAQAREGDLVLLAGKGHEKTQTIAGRVIPFDDVAIARQVLRAQEMSR